MDPGEAQSLRHGDIHTNIDNSQPQSDYSLIVDSGEQRSRRIKRTTWSLPSNTSIRFQLVIEIIIQLFHNHLYFIWHF